jgi:hypothetical protein
MNDTMHLPRAVIDAALGLIPDDLRAGLMAAGPRAAIAGGFLRTVGTQIWFSRMGGPEAAPKDIDVFVDSDDGISVVSVPLRQECDWVRYDRSCTIRREGVPIQVIGEWEFGHPAELIDMFDFSVIRAAMWWDGSAWVGIATSTWRRDINCREANYNTTAPNPSGTLTRIARFAQLGYNIPDGSLASIAVRATEQAQQFAARRYPHRKMEPAEALERLLEERISPAVFEYAGMYDGYD